jgi:hypothetical protein
MEDEGGREREEEEEEQTDERSEEWSTDHGDSLCS